MSKFNIIDLTKQAFDKLKFSAIQSWINGTVEWQNPVILKDQATIIWNPTESYNVQVTLAGSRTLSLPQLKLGQYGTIKIIQGSGGSKTLTLPTDYTNKVANAGAGVLTLSTVEQSVDIATFYYDGIALYWTVSLDFT